MKISFLPIPHPPRPSQWDKIKISGKDIMLTLIARRSRHYAGTRYLRRGVNEEGRVANDVETEQLVFDDTLGPRKISSVCAEQGSIPLFWSHETSKLIIKPDIILHEKDNNYEATRLRFENLRRRYGDTIIILNLIEVLFVVESIHNRCAGIKIDGDISQLDALKDLNGVHCA